ncbi:hypothetical protein ACWGDS_30685 [Streptomyces sp. NPDC055059]|uniref:hypothetical protein n=1 Tax=unclassified Streptomyces TaxID=2593676 RepID=UPI00362971C0
MSDYYDLFLAVDLPPDLAEPVLQELRWLLGQADSAPATHSAVAWEDHWDEPWPVFDGGSASRSFAGADTALLVRAVDRAEPDGSVPWALTVRTCVHEDEFGVVMEAVEWLLRKATTDGWVGFVRSSASEGTHHVVRHQGGFELVDVRSAGKWVQVSWS